MRSLFATFNYCLPKTSYYDIDIDIETLFQFNEEYTYVACKNFIEDHFTKGCKKGVFDIDFRNDYINLGKHTHTASLYLLGILFKPLFFERIVKDLNERRINIGNWYTENDFLYTWYLTCLYHDVASCVEDFDGEDVICDDSIFNKENPYLKGENDIAQQKTRFSESTIKKYYQYRKKSNKQEHGIYGGYLLYDRLVNNFLQQTRGHDWDKEPILCKNNLNWQKEHLNHFAYVADAIICHNIWTVLPNNETGVENYKKYHLEELIMDSQEKLLSIEEYPLHFMLCLFDSIEPVKRFSKLTAREVLENISIKLINVDEVKIGWNDRIKCEQDFWSWMKNISSMKDWMKVDISACKQEDNWCYLVIKFR